VASSYLAWSWGHSRVPTRLLPAPLRRRQAEMSCWQGLGQVSTYRACTTQLSRSSGGDPAALTPKPQMSPALWLGPCVPQGRRRSPRAKRPPQNEKSYFCATTGIAALCRTRVDKHRIFPSPPAASAVEVYADIVTFQAGTDLQGLNSTPRRLPGRASARQPIPKALAETIFRSAELGEEWPSEGAGTSQPPRSPGQMALEVLDSVNPGCQCRTNFATDSFELQISSQKLLSAW